MNFLCKCGVIAKTKVMGLLFIRRGRELKGHSPEGAYCYLQRQG